MTKAELIKSLEQYDDNTELNFFLIPNDGTEEDTDKDDIPLTFVGGISTSGADDENPYIDLGLQEKK